MQKWCAWLELEVRDRTWVERIVLPGSNFRARYWPKSNFILWKYQSEVWIYTNFCRVWPSSIDSRSILHSDHEEFVPSTSWLKNASADECCHNIFCMLQRTFGTSILVQNNTGPEQHFCDGIHRNWGLTGQLRCEEYIKYFGAEQCASRCALPRVHFTFVSSVSCGNKSLREFRQEMSWLQHLQIIGKDGPRREFTCVHHHS
jgi:hypothetical protein